MHIFYIKLQILTINWVKYNFLLKYFSIYMRKGAKSNYFFIFFKVDCICERAKQNFLANLES